MWLHAVGACPLLRSLHHCACDATAAHLGQYVTLQSLYGQIYNNGLDVVQCSLVEGLTPLTRLQHLHLTQCVPLEYFLAWFAMVRCNCKAYIPAHWAAHAP